MSRAAEATPMVLILTACVLVLLLSAVQHERLRVRTRLARAALLEARREQSLRSYAWKIDVSVRQLKVACAQACLPPTPDGDDDEHLLLEAIAAQVRGLVKSLRAKLELCAALAAVPLATPTVAALAPRDLHRARLRRLAYVDACCRWLLPPRRHLRLRIALLRWSLSTASSPLLELHAPLDERGRERLAAAEADLVTLARASVHAYESALRASAPDLFDPQRLPDDPAPAM